MSSPSSRRVLRSQGSPQSPPENDQENKKRKRSTKSTPTEEKESSEVDPSKRGKVTTICVNEKFFFFCFHFIKTLRMILEISSWERETR